MRGFREIIQKVRTIKMLGTTVLDKPVAVLGEGLRHRVGDIAVQLLGKSDA